MDIVPCHVPPCSLRPIEFKRVAVMNGHARIAGELLAKMMNYPAVDLDYIDMVDLRLSEQPPHDAAETQPRNQHPSATMAKNGKMAPQFLGAVLHDDFVTVLMYRQP